MEMYRNRDGNDLKFLDMWKWREFFSSNKPFYLEGIGVGLLLLFTVCLYLPLRHAGFVYDDQWYIVQNRGLRPLNLHAIFTDPKRAAASGSGLAFDAYRPLVTASFALEERLWGLSPIGFHLDNLLLHLLNALLVWLFFRRFISQPSARLLALAVFLWHPVQVQAVAYVSQRTTLLSSAGMLATLLLLDPAEPWSWPKLIGGWLTFAFSLLCRETAGGVILVLAMLEGAAEKRSMRCWIRYAGLLSLTLAFIVVRSHLLPAWSEFAEPRHFRSDAALGVMAFSVYLGKLLWPIHLRAHYAYPNPNGALIAAATGVLLGYFGTLLALVLRIFRSSAAEKITSAMRDNKHFVIALAWIFIFLIPVLQFIPYRGFVSERHLYFSIIGYAWILAIFYTRYRPLRPIFWLVVFYFGIQTGRVVFDWGSDEAMWAASVRQDAHDAFAQASYASSVRDPAQAETHFRLALAENPSADVRFSILTNLARLALDRKEFFDAAALANEALRLVPENPHALYNLMRAEEGLGRLAEADRLRERLQRITGVKFSRVSGR
jgi:protein O-mannosyl-transferase